MGMVMGYQAHIGFLCNPRGDVYAARVSRCGKFHETREQQMSQQAVNESAVRLSVALRDSPGILSDYPSDPNGPPDDDARATTIYVVSRLFFIFAFIVCVVVNKRRRRRRQTAPPME